MKGYFDGWMEEGWNDRWRWIDGWRDGWVDRCQQLKVSDL